MILTLKSDSNVTLETKPIGDFSNSYCYYMNQLHLSEYYGPDSSGPMSMKFEGSS